MPSVVTFRAFMAVWDSERQGGPGSYAGASFIGGPAAPLQSADMPPIIRQA